MASGFRDSGISPILSMISEYRDRSERADIRRDARLYREKRDDLALQERIWQRGRTERQDVATATYRANVLSAAQNDRDYKRKKDTRLIKGRQQISDYYNAPNGAPTNAPNGAPTNAPNGAPTNAPIGAPTNAPNGAPTNAPIGASAVQQYRAPGSTNKLVGNVDMVDNGDGTSTPTVTTDTGVRIPYTFDPNSVPSPTNPTIKIPTNDIQPTLEHIFKTSQAAKDAGVDLSPEQMLSAGFDVSSDGSVKPASTKSFVSAISKSKTSPAKRTLDHFGDPGGGGLGRLAYDIGKTSYDYTTYGTRQMLDVGGRVGTSIRNFLVGLPAIDKTLSNPDTGVSASKTEGGYAKPNITASKVNIKDPATLDALDALKEHNLRNPPSKTESESIANNKVSAIGKKRMLAAYSAAYVAGDPSVTVQNLRNISETGDPLLSAYEKIQRGRVLTLFNLDADKTRAETKKLLAAVNVGPLNKAAAKQKVLKSFIANVAAESKSVSLLSARGDPKKAKVIASRLHSVLLKTFTSMKLDPLKVGDLKYLATFRIAMESYIKSSGGDNVATTLTPFFNSGIGKARGRIANLIMRVSRGSNYSETEVRDYIEGLIGTQQNGGTFNDAQFDVLDENVMSRFSSHK